MTTGFDRRRLPGWESHADAEGPPLAVRDRWRTTRCDCHRGSDSMRINAESGGWICMNCHGKGGDVLAHRMQRRALGFVDAARALRARADDGKPVPTRPTFPGAGCARRASTGPMHDGAPSTQPQRLARQRHEVRAFAG